MSPADAKLQFAPLRDRRYPIHRAAGRLEPYLRLIVERFLPERIILFGSYACGTPTEHSDFDLLIIRRDISSAKQSNLEIRHAIWDVEAAPASFTFLSSTPEEVDEKLRRGSPI